MFGYDSGYDPTAPDYMHGHVTRGYEFDIIDGVPIYSKSVLCSNSWEHVGTVIDARCKILSIEVIQL